MTDKIDVKLCIVNDESIEPSHALPLSLGSLSSRQSWLYALIKTQV